MKCCVCGKEGPGGDLEGRLAVILNDLAAGLLDEKEKETLLLLLDAFNGYVKLHREGK